jgi:hypothetical protein
VGRHDYRGAVGGQLADERPEVAPAGRVDAAGRLVEEDQPRAVQYGGSERGALAHAGRQLSDLACQLVCCEADEAAHILLPSCWDAAVEGAVEAEILRHGEGLVRGEGLRHVADQRAEARGVGGHVEAEDAR